MRDLPGGTFAMGCDVAYPEEAPVRQVTVAAFAIDACPVTNAEFTAFVAATGHVTLAERGPDASDYPPGFDTSVLMPGSFVFTPPAHAVSLRDHSVWWSFVPGACWRAPLGPGSDLNGLDHHPVVHVAYGDAEAYAAWAGKALPTEAEWEYAARGGLDGALFTWGEEHAPGGAVPAQVWRGRFPFQNLSPPGLRRTAPVGSFTPNGFGLLDMAGNVWEWTTDLASPDGPIPRRVAKGGSHLCSPSYCLRYRPAARLAQPVDTTTSHVGFRCVTR